MHATDVQRWLAKRPFEPFSMLLTSGERIDVRHPDAVFPGRTSCHVVYVREGRYVDFADVSLIHIVKLEPLNGQKHRVRRHPRRKRS
ncbi:MAG: hypothetical protein U1D55_06085 [Phycisphaerae bacterium]